MLAIWSEGLAKGSYQTNTRVAVRLEPAIYRLQVRAFYQLSYPGLHVLADYSRCMTVNLKVKVKKQRSSQHYGNKFRPQNCRYAMGMALNGLGIEINLIMTMLPFNLVYVADL